MVYALANMQRANVIEKERAGHINTVRVLRYFLYRMTWFDLSQPEVLMLNLLHEFDQLCYSLQTIFTVSRQLQYGV